MKPLPSVREVLKPEAPPEPAPTLDLKAEIKNLMDFD